MTCSNCLVTECKTSLYSWCHFMTVLVVAVPHSIHASTLPDDFSTTQGTNGIYYEKIADSRSTNVVNPAPAGATRMTLTQPHRYGNWPFVLIDNGIIHMHPGTGGYNLGTGTANIGAGIRFQAYDNRMYNFAGDVARFNESVKYGNGVDFLIVKELDLDNPLFESRIDDNHVVDRRTAFDGTGVVSFDVNVLLLGGESVRLVVFADGQGQDGTFDSTAFRGSMEAYRRGDADLDRDVDTRDLTTSLINFTSVGGAGKTWADGETDGDGDVDTRDLTRAIINFTGALADGQSTVVAVGHRVITGELSAREVTPGMVDLSTTTRTAKRTTVNDQYVSLTTTTSTHPVQLTRVLAGGATRKQVSTHPSIFQSESDWLAAG